jgi:hypothetical protein
MAQLVIQVVTRVLVTTPMEQAMVVVVTLEVVTQVAVTTLAVVAISVATPVVVATSVVAATSAVAAVTSVVVAISKQTREPRKAHLHAGGLFRSRRLP